MANVSIFHHKSHKQFKLFKSITHPQYSSVFPIKKTFIWRDSNPDLLFLWPIRWPFCQGRFFSFSKFVRNGSPLTQTMDGCLPAGGAESTKILKSGQWKLTIVILTLKENLNSENSQFWATELCRIMYVNVWGETIEQIQLSVHFCIFTSCEGLVDSVRRITFVLPFLISRSDRNKVEK
jgi:hypothetical protein